MNLSQSTNPSDIREENKQDNIIDIFVKMDTISIEGTANSHSAIFSTIFINYVTLKNT